MEDTVERAIYLTHKERFEEAMAIFEKNACYKESPLAESYYALCIAAVSKDYKKALALSKEAIRIEFYNPEIYLNIGKICLLMGNKKFAVNVFIKGLKFDPTHLGLIGAMKILGIRRPRMITALKRENILNKMLGKFIRPAPPDPSRPMFGHPSERMGRGARTGSPRVPRRAGSLTGSVKKQKKA